MSVVDELRWDARWTKQDLSKVSRVSHTTIDKIIKDGLINVSALHGSAVVRALSDRLLELGKIQEPLVYEDLRDQDRRPDQIAC